LCTSASCIHAASDILYNLHPDYANIDPCTDFDEFVCGGWEERHDLRSDQADIFTGTIMAEQAQSILLHIFDAEQAENATACPGTSVEDKNFCKAKAAYDACMDEATIEKQGVKPLQTILDKVVELYPIEGSDENSLTDTIGYLSDIGTEALLSIYISVCSVAILSIVD
jgi:endothelin-converting enzyme